MAGPSDSFHLLKGRLLALKRPLKGHGLFLSRSGLLWDAGSYVRSVDVTGAVRACGSVNRWHYLQSTVLCENWCPEDCVMAGGVSWWRLKRTVHSASEEEQKGYFCHGSTKVTHEFLMSTMKMWKFCHLTHLGIDNSDPYLYNSPLHLQWKTTKNNIFLLNHDFFAFYTSKVWKSIKHYRLH